jgi:hypothetical protein
MNKSLRLFTSRAILLTTTLTMLAACTSGVGGRRGSVWDTYDYRHPVPGGVGLPNPSGYYSDNDNTYTNPTDLDCSPDHLTLCE